MVKFLKVLSIIIIIIFCGLGFYFRNEHPHFIWEKFPVFDAIFGFIGCIVIIFAAKILGKLFLQKGEDYYDD